MLVSVALTPAARRRVALPAAWMLLAAAPLAAQGPGGAGDDALAARVRAFLQAAPSAPNDSVATFFPRRGDWTWVQTPIDTRGRGMPERTGVWRFGGAETLRAIGAGGPVCLSFDGIRGEFGPHEGRFGMQTQLNREPWRRVRGTRFVPADASADSPVFVEWRREDGAWVVSSFGDESVYFEPSARPPVALAPGAFSRDTAGVAEDAAFAPADWYTVTINGRRYPKYGLPRPLNETERASLARIGVLHGVSVFARRGDNPEWPGVVYLLTAPGQFQPYDTAVPEPCG